MIVVVGGQARHVGKTAVICDIIRAYPEAHWTAIKITTDAHGADLTTPILIEQTSVDGAGTGRYLSAGAARSYWLRAKPEHIWGALLPVLGGNLIIESTTVMDVIEPDLFILVEDPAATDWKPAALRHATSAHLRTTRRVNPELIDRVRSMLSAPAVLRRAGSPPGPPSQK